MTRQKVISASGAARLIPDDAIVTVSSSSAAPRVPGRCVGCDRTTLRGGGSSAEPHDPPSDRRGRHVGVKGVDHLAEADVSPGFGRFLSVWPVFRRTACNLEDDHRRRDPGLQRAFGNSVRYSPRGGGQVQAL